MAGDDRVARESTAGEKVNTRELRPQLSTLSNTSTDAVFSAPGPMQTSTPGTPTCNHPARI